MRKFLTLMMLATTLLVACEPSNEEQPKATLKIMSEAEMSFTTEGGEGVILYELSNYTGTTPISVECGAEWIDLLGVEAESVKFEVKRSVVEEPREAIITLSIEDSTESVKVKQAAAEPLKADVEFVAKMLNGSYYGTAYTPEIGSLFYQVILSDNGAPAELEFKPNSIYYYFGIFSDQTTDESNPKVPNGVYTFDNTYSFQPGVFDDSFSAYYITNDTECNWQLFLDGRVEVSDNHIDAIVTLADGTVHHITYDGDLRLTYPNNSTLSGDYNFSMTDAYIEAWNYGDYYAAGGNNWLVYVFPDYEVGTGEGFWLDIIAHDYNEKSITGEYICKEAYETGVFFPGFTAAGIYYGSWYIDYENFQPKGEKLAPLIDGSIKITDSEDGTAALSIEGVDDGGNKITCQITGNIDYYNFSDFE